MSIAEHEITALCSRLKAAHASKDAAAIVACYAPDALVYNLAPPLATRGIDCDETAAWLATWEGPVTIDTADATITTDGNIGWMIALQRIRGTKIAGEVEDIWYRATYCFHRQGNAWRIAHEHTSTPFYMDGSMRAAVDLGPETAIAGRISQ